MAETEFVIEPGRQDIVMTRVFDAPREVVFRAYTDPELVPNWCGPHSLTTEVDRMDVRPGGLWRFINRGADGNEYAFKGVYHDVVAPERVVSTFEFEGAPGHVLLSTVTFEMADGGTRLTELSVFQSVEDRDGMVQSGMEHGARESMDRLAEVAQSLKSESAV
nr:SRPBCC family protein [Allosalinactinospora lopnorensis]